MWQRLKEIFRRLLTTHAAWPVLLALGLLCTASILALQVSSPERAVTQQHHLLLGAALMIAVMLPHYEWFGRMAYVFMAVVVGLLALVLVTDPIKGSHRWFSLGAFAVQPSELAKIGFVLALAWYLRYRKNFREPTGLIGPFLLMLVPFGLVLVEPDLGTAMLFPITLYAMLTAAGARLRHLIMVAVLAAVVLPGMYPLLQPYQQERIKDLVIRLTAADHRDISQHLKGDGFQAHISQIAIGSGGAYGLPEGADTPRVLPPEAYTDCIFTVVGSRWGFAGCVVVIAMYLAFFGAAIEIAASTKDPFGRMVAVGMASIILAQAFINMAMTTGMAPIVGIALPFMSYGGSSLIANMLAAGILLNISVRRHTKTTSLPASYAAA